MNDFRYHGCGHSTDEELGVSREICSFCAAKAVSPDKRSSAMKAVVEGEQLQTQISDLLNPYKVNEDREMDCLVKLVDMHLLYDGAFLRMNRTLQLALVALILDSDCAKAYCKKGLSCGNVGSLEHFAMMLALVKSPKCVLAAVPLIHFNLQRKSNSSAGVYAAVALDALRRHQTQWDAVFQRHGLSATKVEGILRYAFNNAAEILLNEPGVSHWEKATLRAIRQETVYRMLEIDPAAPWVSACASSYFLTVKHDPVRAMQKLLPGLQSAEKAKNELLASPLQWTHCYLMLLLGNRPGHKITVSTFLAHVEEAKESKEKLDSWGEFRCPDTGGWSPVQMRSLAKKDEYWRTLGVAARLKGAVRHDPAVAETKLPAFTEQQLEKELVHVRCDKCKELCDSLLFCARCERAKCCSKDCQKRHWVAKHRRDCTAATKGTHVLHA